MSEQFIIASARGIDIDVLVESLFTAIAPHPAQATLGFLYVTDALAASLEEILRKLRQRFQVQDWVGTVGLGICYTGNEIYDEPAAVIMLTQLQGYELFEVADANSNIVESLAHTGSSIAQADFGIIHGNPNQVGFPQTFQQLCLQLQNTFFVGGLSSSKNVSPQILNRITEPAVSGVLFTNNSGIVVSHTQGCSAMENKHLITKCEKNLVLELDHRPALDVFKEDVGEVLAKDLEKVNGYIFAGLPVQHSDTNDYLVRNIIGFDLNNSIIAIGDYVEEGSPMMFCRRDGNSAVEDMQTMLQNIKARISEPPKGALYYSCLARGRNQFGEDSAEIKMIQQQLGDVPLVGFFANGEILHNRLYGYTGVLTLFT